MSSLLMTADARTNWQCMKGIECDCHVGLQYCRAENSGGGVNCCLGHQCYRQWNWGGMRTVVQGFSTAVSGIGERV